MGGVPSHGFMWSDLWRALRPRLALAVAAGAAIGTLWGWSRPTGDRQARA